MLYIKDTFLKIKAFLFNPYYKLIFLSCLFIYSCGTEIYLQESLRKKQLKEEKRKAKKNKRKERKSNKGF